MSVFEDFEREFGPGEDCLVPGDDWISRYRGRLPDPLLDLWREAGWCSYGNGMLWVVDPAQLSDVIEDWDDSGAEPPLAFLRTSFGHVYFWRDGSVWSLDVHRGSLSRVTENIALMFTLLGDPEIRTKMLRQPLHEEMVARLGRPERDECFAFVPALALGGSGAPETVQRVRMREQLGILAQLTG
jgi:hypothetical protein